VDAAARPAGLYEDNNPWPIAGVGMTGASANDLAAALTYLNTNGVAGKYGAYTVRLGVDPTLPVYPGAKITLGGIPSANSYAAIKQTRIIIEGTTGAAVIMPLTDVLWTLLDNNTVSNGNGVAQELVKSATPGSTEWVVPWDDDYLIELNGAAGGNGYGAGGKGGYIKGTIHLAKGVVYTINVGGAGGNQTGGASATGGTGGFNGGGKGGDVYTGTNAGGGGGGATDIRTVGGDYATRIIVAGGGGGGSQQVTGHAMTGGNAGNGAGGSGGAGISTSGNPGRAGATLVSGNANGIGGAGSNGNGSAYQGGGGGGGGYYGAYGGIAAQSAGGGSTWADTGDGMFTNVTPPANGAGAHTGNGSVRIIALMRQ
jgi:hypothetical protein